MADEPTYDWSTAPKEMREAFEKMQADTKELRDRDAAASARLAVIDRREAFDKVKGELGDAAKDVSLEDLGETPLEQITATTLKVKATEKAEARAAAETEMAKALGFENVEELRAFRTDAETRRQAPLASQTTTAAAAMSGQNSQEIKKTVDEQAFEAFNANPHLPHDERVAAFLGASIGAQLTEAEKEKGAKL